MTLDEAVGLVLREAREARGLSQEKFGAEAGIARTYVSLIELGSSSLTLGTLEKACIWHGVTVSSVLIQAEQLMRSAASTTKGDTASSGPRGN